MKDSDVKPQRKVRFKLPINQWHFIKKNPHYIIVNGISGNQILVKFLSFGSEILRFLFRSDFLSLNYKITFFRFYVREMKTD